MEENERAFSLPLLHSPSLMPASPTAARVALDTTAQTLTIAWADGHTSVFPLDGLRRACPCAQCRGHGGTRPGPEVFDEPPEQTWTDVQAEAVGSYALRLRWDDGHNTGLYRWTRLRALCPCAECRSEEAHTGEEADTDENAP